MNDKQLKRTIEEITSDLTHIRFRNQHTKEVLNFAIENNHVREFLVQFDKLSRGFLLASVDVLESLSLSINEKDLTENPLIKYSKELTKETQLFMLLLKNQLEYLAIKPIPLSAERIDDSFHAVVDVKL